MKYSIIVPVYNVQDYLPICLNSLIIQNYNDYEIILVDDGSTDQSGRICDDYANRHQTIRCFHKKNGGLSDARNYGMSESKGDFLIFVDGDDYVADDFLRVFDSVLLSKTEVLITRLVEEFSNEKISRDLNMSDILISQPSKKKAVDWIMNKSFNTWPAQKYVVSRSFVKENNLFFKRGFLHEDIDWTSKVCLLAKQFAVCDMEWYYHRVERAGSIMNSINPRRITDVIKIAYDLNSFIATNQSSDMDIKRMVKERVLRSVYPALNLCKKIEKRDLDYVISVAEECRSVFFEAPCFKYKLFDYIIKLLGIRRSLRLLSCL